MKSIIIFAALTLASDASASDLWLESVHGSYNCHIIYDDTSLTMEIDSVTKHISLARNDNKLEATMIDVTESLAVMQREVGFKQFNLVVPNKKAPTIMMFKTSSGKLLMKDIDRSGNAKDWELPAFTPDSVCEKTN